MASTSHYKRGTVGGGRTLIDSGIENPARSENNSADDLNRGKLPESSANALLGWSCSLDRRLERSS